jgi:peroxiredoxin
MALDSKAVLERGDAAPDFVLEGADGEARSLDDFARADALLLVFTCNHCPYAKAKVDELNRLAAEFDDLAVVGINPNDETQYPQDSIERMRALVDDGTIDWDAYLRDETQTVAADYGAVCTPDPFLFDNDDGTFRLAYHGRLDDAPNPDDEPSDREMARHVGAVLAGDDVDAEMRPSRGCSIKWREGNEPDYWT